MAIIDSFPLPMANARIMHQPALCIIKGNWDPLVGAGPPILENGENKPTAMYT